MVSLTELKTKLFYSLVIPFCSVKKTKESLADLYAKGFKKESIVTYMGRW